MLKLIIFIMPFFWLNTVAISVKQNTPTVMLLGEQGVGKSTLANVLLGLDHMNQDGSTCFKVGHFLSVKSTTEKTCMKTGPFLGLPNSTPVTVVDTPGFDAGMVVSSAFKDMNTFLKENNLKVNTFGLLWRQMDTRVTYDTQQMLKTFYKGFGKVFLYNLVIIVTHWNMHESSVELRMSQVPPLTEQYMEESLNKILVMVFKFQLDEEENFKVPVLFLDSYYNRTSYVEKFFFESNANMLLAYMLQRSSYNLSHITLAQTEVQHLNSKLAMLDNDLTYLAKVIEDLKNEGKEPFKLVTYLKENIIHVILLSMIALVLIAFAITCLGLLIRRWRKLHTPTANNNQPLVENIQDDNEFMETNM